MAVIILTLLSFVGLSQSLNLYEQLSALNLTTAKQLVDNAGLQSTLTNDGPFTLIVPTEKAFSKLSPAELNMALHQTQLDTASYHAIPGIHRVHDFLFGKHYYYNSTNNHTIRVYRSASGLHFNQATAVKTDIPASNGVIHLIDTVLDVPEGTVMDILNNPAYNLSKFLDIVKKSHLERNYANPAGLNRYTVFAPDNAAMSNVSQTMLNKLAEDYTYLRMLVEYHVHSGTLHASSLTHRHYVSTTLPAHNISLSTNANGDILLNNLAHVKYTDIEAENGVVHVISHVLIPQILGSFIVG